MTAEEMFEKLGYTKHVYDKGLTVNELKAVNQQMEELGSTK